MPRWVPLLVSLVTCALLAGSVYAAERVGTPAPVRGAAARFVPAVHVRVEGAGTPVTQVVESARAVGLPMVQGLNFVFGAYLLQSLGGEAAAATQTWRTTATTMTAAADRTAQPAALLYRVDGAVELLGESSPGRGRIFRPALVELPADVAPGATWTGAGTAGQDLSYRSRFRAEAADRGCLLVTGEVAYADAAGRAGETEQHRKRWCPGQGIVEQQVQVGRRDPDHAYGARSGAADPVDDHASDPLDRPGALVGPDRLDPLSRPQLR